MRDSGDREAGDTGADGLDDRRQAGRRRQQRGRNGKLARELVEMDRAGATNEELGRKMDGFAGLRRGMLEGDMDAGNVSVGHGITHIHEIRTAKEIVDELTADWR